MKKVFVISAQLNNPDHAKSIISLLSSYATDTMGGGKDLSPYVKKNLIPALKTRPGVYVFLAMVQSEPVGLGICFEGFSTFFARPLLNIHDLIVIPEFRGLGIGKKILEKIEDKAKELKCCKLTLEVLEGNQRARKLYNQFGFGGYELDEKLGKALFWEKKLD